VKNIKYCNLYACKFLADEYITNSLYKKKTFGSNMAFDET
jgi:hypothetical protein